MTQIEYNPPKSVVGFLTSEKFISLICGPIGSTKTTASIMKIAYHAQKMAACKDGIRRSKCVVVRNTTQQLSDTTIPDFLKWFPDGVAGSYHKTEKRFVMRFADVECEVLFRGLDDANDVRRLLSLQASFAVFDEYREINRSIFETMQGRLGRYPDGSMVAHRPEWGVDEKGHPIQGCVTDDGEANKHLWGASNPPDADSFFEEFMSSPPATADIFIQPGGMTQEADWIQFLPSMYYEDLMQGKSQDWIDVYIHAKFGRSLSGKPVYPSYKDDYHVTKEPMRPLRADGYPLLIGMDFGLTPAAVIGQVDPWGRLNILAEATSEGMGVLQFARQRLKPLLVNKFAGLPVTIIGDPAGNQRAQTNEATVFQILRAEGFQVIPARSNAVAARLAAVQTYLDRTVDTKAGLQIDPSCTVLRKAFRGGYRYKLKKAGDAEETPDKNEFSHISDAMQYLCLHADGGRTFGQKLTMAQAMPVEQVSSAGWT